MSTRRTDLDNPPAGHEWVSCTARDYGPAGVQVHLIATEMRKREYWQNTICGSTASVAGIWRRPSWNSTKPKCLAPYAPNDTKVRATGTYYAFQPNNGTGVHEYAAELAVRYFREHTQLRAVGKLDRPAFKCGPPENARAWQALVDEFFAGRDLVPPCTE